MEKQGLDTKDMPAAPKDEYILSTYVFCEYCERKFAPKVAERHIPLCKDIANRPKPPKIPNQKF
jgi:hypothetical protein